MRLHKFRLPTAPLSKVVAAHRDERGMATAEYAIVMLAAAAFAGLLMLVLRSDTVREALTSIVQQALSI